MRAQMPMNVRRQPGRDLRTVRRRVAFGDAQRAHVVERGALGRGERDVVVARAEDVRAGGAVINVVISVVFGMLVAFAGTLRGMQAGRSAQAVGLAATSAVVTSIDASGSSSCASKPAETSTMSGANPRTAGSTALSKASR